MRFYKNMDGRIKYSLESLKKVLSEKDFQAVSVVFDFYVGKDDRILEEFL